MNVGYSLYDPEDFSDGLALSSVAGPIHESPLGLTIEGYLRSFSQGLTQSILAQFGTVGKSCVMLSEALSVSRGGDSDPCVTPEGYLRRLAGLNPDLREALMTEKLIRYDPWRYDAYYIYTYMYVYIYIISVFIILS